MSLKALWHIQLYLTRVNGYLGLRTEAKGKSAAFTKAFWKYIDISTARFHNLLDYREAKADSLVIHFCTSMQLTESSEELCHVFVGDPYASILDRGL